MATRHTSRRTFLRGLGVTMALPWMESISVWGDETAKPGNKAPVRLAVLFSGNGFHSGQWWAKGEGTQVKPLPEPHSQRIRRCHGIVESAKSNGRYSLAVVPGPGNFLYLATRHAPRGAPIALARPDSVRRSGTP